MYNVSVGENKPCKWGMSEHWVWRGQTPAQLHSLYLLSRVGGFVF